MRLDDDRLLQSLHEGIFETPLWRTFLDALLAKTGAGFAALQFRPVDGEGDVQFYAETLPARSQRRVHGDDKGRDPIDYTAMRPDRAYALEELLSPDDAQHQAYYETAMRPQGLTHMRSIRVTEPGGIDLWLSVAGGKGIGLTTGALLTALAPHLRIALRGHTALERERFRASVTARAIERLKMGWLTLDGQCRILEATANVELLFQWGMLLRRGRYDRLMPSSPQIDRQLTALVKSYGRKGEGKSQAFRLSQDPWVDMLVTPAPEQMLTGGNKPVAIIYVSGDRRSQAARSEQLAELFGLLPSEARLAWMLAQAASISESAEALGLTIETARNYSKKIYAKTGARGQAELVRIVLTSVLAIS